MRVFISWSGNRSNQCASILSKWLKKVVQAADIWMSTEIEKGTRWNDSISKQLEQTRVGIICLTPENLASEWVLFEAGALSKTTDSHVCTFLLGLKPTDIKPPLSQFNHTIFEKEDIRKLVHTINSRIVGQDGKSFPKAELDELFEDLYPKLEAQLKGIPTLKENQDVVRTEREILEEILGLVRQQDRKLPSIEIPMESSESASSGKIRVGYGRKNKWIPVYTESEINEFLDDIKTKTNID